MKVKKYVCPLCGGSLQYWKEYLVTKTQNINPNTGVLSKTVHKSNLTENNGDMRGLQCQNKECCWSINDVNQSIPEEFEDWYEMNESDINV